VTAEASRGHSLVERCSPSPEVAVRHEGRDERGRFAPGTQITRAGSVNRITRTMRLEALQAMSAAGPSGNPLLSLFSISQDKDTPLRVRVYVLRELVRAIWGDRVISTLEVEPPDPVDESRISSVRAMLASILLVEKHEQPS